MSYSDEVVRIAPWRDDGRFAYSITYDEGLIETLGFAWRIHRRFGIPGHINVFPGMLGELVGDTSAGFLQSLWNLQKYADPVHLRFLLDEGWTVGCQFHLDDQGRSAASLLQTRLSLEEAMAHPVRALAFADFKSCEASQGVARDAGFRWLFTLYDGLNVADEATDVVRRSPLFHEGPTPIRLANDPYRLLALARDRGGWVVDVVRLVDRYPLDPARDCTPAELEARFKAVYRIGGDRVWAASPERVVGYRFLRLSTRIQDYVAGPHQICYTLAVAPAGGCDPQGELTFVAHLGETWRSPQAIVAVDTVPLRPSSEPGKWIFTHRVADGLEVRIEHGSGRSV